MYRAKCFVDKLPVSVRTISQLYIRVALPQDHYPTQEQMLIDIAHEMNRMKQFKDFCVQLKKVNIYQLHTVNIHSFLHNKQLFLFFYSKRRLEGKSGGHGYAWAFLNPLEIWALIISTRMTIRKQKEKTKGWLIYKLSIF